MYDTAKYAAPTTTAPQAAAAASAPAPPILRTATKHPAAVRQYGAKAHTSEKTSDVSACAYETLAAISAMPSAFAHASTAMRAAATERASCLHERSSSTTPYKRDAVA